MTGYHTDDLELASEFQPLESEANFGPPLTREVVGAPILRRTAFASTATSSC